MIIIRAVATGIFGGALYPLALVARVCGVPVIALAHSAIRAGGGRRVTCRVGEAEQS